MAYVNGYVLPVPAANKEKYRQMAERFGAFCVKEHGALQYVECWGDDVPDGEQTSFARSVHLQDDEAVVFAWVLWPDKETCQTAMKAMHEGPEMQGWEKEMPFDTKRMFWGGFEVLVQL